MAIGGWILDLAGAQDPGLLDLGTGPLFDLPFWNNIMDRGPDLWAQLRARLTDMLAEGAAGADALTAHLVAQSDVTMWMPFPVAEYTDLHACKHHATNVGTMFRGAASALPPNWLRIPIGYNGRASSVVVAGTDVIRPNGQTKAPDADIRPLQALGYQA